MHLHHYYAKYNSICKTLCKVYAKTVTFAVAAQDAFKARREAATRAQAADTISEYDAQQFAVFMTCYSP